MIGGFIITGTVPKKVMIRALGPSLVANGVPLPGSLQNPTLELRDRAGQLLAANDNWQTNDNWRSDQESEILATQVAPTLDAEAALVRTLAPGAYTAIVRGAQDTSGTAIVEAYNLP